METDQFYCVGCQELKEAVYGHRVFRTGYFRLVYPLGCCLICASRETARPAASADESMLVFEPLEDARRPASITTPADIEPSAARSAVI